MSRTSKPYRLIRIDTKKKSRGFIRRATLLAISVIMLVPIIGIIYLEQKEYVVSATETPPQLPAETSVDLPWPKEGAAAIGAHGIGILESSPKSRNARPIASITKLFTAVALLSKKPLPQGQQGEEITFTQTDSFLYEDYLSRGGAVVPVYGGMKLTYYQALEAMLLPSANNIADSLVVWAFGSMDNYLEYANQYFQDKGLESTILADASGFSPRTKSSPKDLIALGELAVDQAVLIDIVNKPSVVLPKVGRIYSTNEIINQQNIIGGKTGFTPEAGDCFLFIAENNVGLEDENQIIGVVLGQPSRPATFSATKKLLAAAQKGFREINIIQRGETVGVYNTEWGVDTDVIAKKSISLIGWESKLPEVDINIEPVRTVQPKGKTVGRVTVTYGQKLIETPAVTSSDIENPDYLWAAQNIF